MTLQEGKNAVSSCIQAVVFTYKGKPCGVDPFSDDNFDVWYGDTTVKMNTLNEVFNAPFFDGKSLSEIWDSVDADYG